MDWTDRSSTPHRTHEFSLKRSSRAEQGDLAFLALGCLDRALPEPGYRNGRFHNV